MRLIGRTGRDGSDARLDGKLADIFDDRRTPGAPESLYAYVREVSMTEQGPQAGRLTGKWSGLGRTGRVGVSLAAALVIVAGAVTAIGLIRGGPAGPGAGSPSPAVPPRPAVPSGWQPVVAIGTADDSGGLWTVARFVDASEPGHPGYRTLAVHVTCTGVDELVVVLSGGAVSGNLHGRTRQSAVFGCDFDPSAGESRVIFTAADEPFTEVWAVIIRNPSSLVTNDWVVSIEAADAGASPSPTP